ncbi:MAG: hypothetical protein CM15mP120_15090 [Pseudomonadota bacterium]|nr:MAG: hypothetical protein CM15mP120_15090 [Pseudomonadota bacterium]
MREWLQHQACVGQIEYDATSKCFALSAEAHAVLVDADHPAYLMGAYDAALSGIPGSGKVTAIVSVLRLV